MKKENKLEQVAVSATDELLVDKQGNFYLAEGEQCLQYLSKYTNIKQITEDQAYNLLPSLICDNWEEGLFLYPDEFYRLQQINQKIDKYFPDRKKIYLVSCNICNIQGKDEVFTYENNCVLCKGCGDFLRAFGEKEVTIYSLTEEHDLNRDLDKGNPILKADSEGTFFLVERTEGKDKPTITKLTKKEAFNWFCKASEVFEDPAPEVLNWEAELWVRILSVCFDNNDFNPDRYAFLPDFKNHSEEVSSSMGLGLEVDPE